MTTHTRTTAVIAVLCLVAGALSAQEIPADAVLKDFEPLGDYRLTLDGVDAVAAELFLSQAAGSAVLVLSSQLAAPVIVHPRQRTVEIVAPDKVARREGGSIDILADATVTPIGELTIEGANLAFEVDGKTARLEPKAWLLGVQDTAGMLASNASYRYGAGQYTPSPVMLRKLREVGAVRVRVYFGSWCPHCKLMLPRILRVAEELDGSKIVFDYYGLPSPFGDEPEALRRNIVSVPTGVVYRGEVEIGRIGGNEWKVPELALKNVVE